ncbi:MAG: hypothetical protein PHN41_00530 [Bacteroidales bacterium]|jgi:hypothetical protein|nr:hypothetical protein [Bacteroidales bacterium]MDD4702785.1 hypothetical protein [Bacteroidales bacterium]MDX9798147.1 hypothetical protein [Bacteroidales bacterium]
MKTRIRKSTLLLMGMLMLVPTLNAQHHRNEHQKDRRAIDSACQYHGARNLHNKLKPKKIGYITRELQLTEQEAQKFWPIYDRYEEELMSIREKRRPKDTTDEGFPKRPDFLKMTNSQAEEMLENHFKAQKEIMALEEKYSIEMKKAIPAQKVIMLFHAEKRFLRDVIGTNWKDKEKRSRRR